MVIKKVLSLKNVGRFKSLAAKDDVAFRNRQTPPVNARGCVSFQEHTCFHVERTKPLTSHSLISPLFDGPLDVIGDIHGELGALHTLLERLGYDADGKHAEGRRLVFTGDLCDRGPDSPGVIELVRGLVERGRAQCVLGNHELNLLRGDLKHGNAWCLDATHSEQHGEFGHSKAAPAEHSLHEFFLSLPLALERPDLRVVHAAWHQPSIELLRAAEPTVLDVYEHYERDTLDYLESAGIARAAHAEKQSHATELENSSRPMTFLSNVGSYDELLQMRNPVRVLTSGPERVTDTPFWANGKWRMCERVKWWNDYTADIPVIVGHYWRRAVDDADTTPATPGREPNLFADNAPHEWVGPKQNVYCVDFSIGGRYREVAAGLTSFKTRLAAVRWPERLLVFHEGSTTAMITEPHTRATGTQPPRPDTHELPWSLLGAFDLPTAEPRSTRQVSSLLRTLEEKIAASPATCFAEGPDGTVTLSVDGQSFHAGRFEVATIATLKTRLNARSRSERGKLRLSAFRGEGERTDIGALQATAPSGVLFQVASQFNCLEAPGPRLVPVSTYPTDGTQGPRASVSAFPGTFLRHYFAPGPDGTRYVQTDTSGINLLAAVTRPGIARVESGYLLADQIENVSAFAKELEANFEQLQVGLHDDVEVVLGADWGGAVPQRGAQQRIAQAFTSTIALGGYSRDDGSPMLARVREQLLRAAYLGTILGALALGKRCIVLTLIGGGVFGNPHRAIWDAIHWALEHADAYADSTVEVIVNVRDSKIAEHDIERIHARRGAIIELGTDEIRLRR